MSSDPSVTSTSSTTPSTEKVVKTSDKPPAALTSKDLKEPRLYVGNLAFDAKIEDLEGELKANDISGGRVEILHHKEGRPKGCAIIEFDSVEDAVHCANIMANKEIKGRKIYLREDREDKGFVSRPSGSKDKDKDKDSGSSSRGGRGRGGRGGFPSTRGTSIFSARGGRGRGGASSTSTSSRPAAVSGSKIYVGNLSYNTQWQELKDTFSEHGTVVRADVATDRVTNRSKGFGTVTMSSAEEAEAAIAALNETELDGRNIAVRLDQYQ